MTKIAVLVGSSSDLVSVRESKMMEVFDATGLSVPVHVISCHRNPDELAEYCRNSDVDVFITAAGLAAALPGATAAACKMERVVIGVPLDDYGIDTCIRLPAGTPVVTAGVGRAGLRNAAISACQIAALAEPDLLKKLVHYLDSQRKGPEFGVSI